MQKSKWKYTHCRENFSHVSKEEGVMNDKICSKQCDKNDTEKNYIHTGKTKL